jgi:membrane protease YdiL (CAAX protease family)
MRRNPSPFAAFATFILLIAGALLIAAVLSPLIFWTLDDYPIHRIFNRIAELVFLIGAYLWVRRQPNARRAALGFNKPAATLWRHALAGFVAGLLLMGVMAMLMLWLGVRQWHAGQAPIATALAQALPVALLSGVLVGLVEETFFRGLLYGSMRRHGSQALAVLVTSLSYAAVHYLGERTRIPAQEVDWSSGFVMLSRFFAAFLLPLRILDGFVALTLVGALLAVVRERLGSVAPSIGMHAGFVTVIACLRSVSEPVREGPWSFLIGSRDGIVGWLVAALTFCTLIFAVYFLRPRTNP